MTPTAPGGRSLSYKMCLFFTHSICYWEVCIQFRSGGKFSAFFSRGISHGEGSFQGVNLSGEMSH